jgi:hypothetical protein
VADEQFFQPTCQMAGTLFAVPGNGVGNDLAQDPAMSVRVMGGENVDGQHRIEPVT